jgi:hypothetical protein
VGLIFSIGDRFPYTRAAVATYQLMPGRICSRTHIAIHDEKMDSILT